MPLPIRFPSIRTKLARKLGLLLVASFVLSLTALWLVQRVQRQALADLLASETRERTNMLKHGIDLTARVLRDFASDYAQWDDMVRFVKSADQQWAIVNLDASLEKFTVSGTWVLRTDGSLVYATRGDDTRPPPPLPVPAATLRALLAEPPAGTFFVQLSGRLVELFLAPVLPSDDRLHAAKPRGWVLAEKTWDAAQVKLLADLIHCEGHTAPPNQPLPPPQPNQITLRYPLRGPEGETVADFVYVIRSEELAISARHSRSTLLVLAVSCLVTGLIVIVALYGWVLRPLGAIGDSLARNDPAPTGFFAQRSDEMGRLARLVETSFVQRAELERNLAERARLGRDLHDGVIQTIYAAGMSLSGLRPSLRTDPVAAERLIDEIREALNTTIRDLRTFIDGLEPEHSTRFSEATRSILTLLQGVRPIGFSLQIDDTLADQLNKKVWFQLLQIVRESATNCVRHSEAHNIQILLRRDAGAVSLEIIDDGGGFEATPGSPHGRGLINLAERSRELGGVLRVESTPGNGLRLHLTFPSASDGQS